MWTVLESLAVAAPDAIVKITAMLVLMILALFGLAIYKTKAADRANIIRALAEFMSALMRPLRRKP